jgi:hypothetical protein
LEGFETYSTEYTLLSGLLCTKRTTFTQISIFSQHFLSRSFFSLCPPLILILKVLEVVDEAGEDALDLPDFVGQLGQVVHKQELPLQTPTPCHSRQQQIKSLLLYGRGRTPTILS